MGPTARLFVSGADGYLGGAVARAAAGGPGSWSLTGSALSGTGVGSWVSAAAARSVCTRRRAARLRSPPSWPRRPHDPVQEPSGSPAALRAALAADVIVLDLLGAPAEARSVLDAVQAQLLAAAAEPAARGPPARQRTVIGLSSVATWDGGAGAGGDGAASPAVAAMTEASHATRVTPPGAAHLRQLEEQLLGLARPQRLRTVLVACGLPYGHGHGPLAALLQRARGTLADGAPLPMPCLRRADGGNAVPTIHVDDAARFVCKLAAVAATAAGTGGDGDPAPLLQRVYVAVDAAAGSSSTIAGEFPTTLASIATAVACSVGSGVTTPVASPARVLDTFPDGAAAAMSLRDLHCAAPAPDPSLVTALLPLTQVDVAFDVGSLAIHGGSGGSDDADNGRDTAVQQGRALVALAPDEWHCRRGPAHPSSLSLLRDEYVSATGAVPTRVCVTGPPAAGKTTVARHVAESRGLPLVSLASAVDAFLSAGGSAAAASGGAGAAAVDVGGAAGVVRALGDGTPTRAACLRALWDAVAKYGAEAEAAVAAQQQAQAQAAVSGSGKAAAAGGTKAAAAKAAPAAGSAKPPAVAAAADSTAAPAAAGGGPSPPPSSSQLPASIKPPRLPLVLLSRVVRAVLTAPAYRASGWVLDGAPRTGAEAAALFGAVTQPPVAAAAPGAPSGGDDTVAGGSSGGGGGAVTQQLEDPDGLMPPPAVMAALGLPLAPYVGAYVAARGSTTAGGGGTSGSEAPVAASSPAPSASAAAAPNGGATTTAKPVGAKKAGDTAALGAPAAASAAGAGRKDAKAAAAVSQPLLPALKVDAAFIAACLTEEADADVAALAHAAAAGITVSVMGSVVKPPAPAAVVPAVPPPTTTTGGKASGDKAAMAAAAPPVPPAVPSPAPTSAVNHHLAPHLVLVLDAVHDVALQQRLPPAAAEAAGDGATPNDTTSNERFLRKLRRYRIHNAAGSAESVGAWAAGAVARNAAADGFRAALATCVGGPAVGSLNVNATTGDGLLRAAGMLVTDARLAAVRRARQAAPLLLAGVRLSEEEGEQQQQQQPEGGGEGEGAAATGVNDAAGGRLSPHGTSSSRQQSPPAQLPPTPLPLAAAQRLEERHLDERTAPARAALMQALLPHISDGLVAVCATDPPPANPVLALARYLQAVADARKQRAGAARGGEVAAVAAAAKKA
jgi:hypothetical protein